MSLAELITTPTVDVELPGGSTVTMRPITYGRLVRLRGPITSAFRSFTGLVQAGNGAIGRHESQSSDGSMEVSQLPMRVESMVQLDRFRSQYVGSLVDAFLEPKHTSLWVEAILESLDEDLTEENKNAIKDADILTLRALLFGFFKAHQGLFGPFESRAKSLLRSRLERLMQESEQKQESLSNSDSKPSGTETEEDLLEEIENLTGTASPESSSISPPEDMTTN